MSADLVVTEPSYIDELDQITDTKLDWIVRLARAVWLIAPDNGTWVGRTFLQKNGLDQTF
jgi:hypothetical protein